jgi:hypothetical protein
MHKSVPVESGTTEDLRKKDGLPTSPYLAPRLVTVGTAVALVQGNRGRLYDYRRPTRR